MGSGSLESLHDSTERKQMKIHSKALLRAVIACKAIRISSPVAPEYDYVRIRIGYGNECCEAFNGSDLLRHGIAIEYDDGLGVLDSAFEYAPLISWLSYADGEVTISEKNGKIVFDDGSTKLEKPKFDTMFPIRNAPEEKGPFIELGKDDWAFLRSNTGELHGNTNCNALHVSPGPEVYVATTDGRGISIVKIEPGIDGPTIEEPTVIPADEIDAAFKAMDKDSITIECTDNGFFVGHGSVEYWFAGSAHTNVLHGMCRQWLEKDKPFISIGVGEVKDAIGAIHKAFESKTKDKKERPRAKFFTRDGSLFVVGGEFYDFYSKPLRPLEIEFPEDIADIIVDAKMMSDALAHIDGQLWFLTDPRLGPTNFKVISNDGQRQCAIMPMSEKKRS